MGSLYVRFHLLPDLNARRYSSQYRPVQLRTLQVAQPSTIDSLSAFLPGMQILAGDIDSAIKTHLVFWNLWRKYSAMPESWSWDERRVVWSGWPGRPEFIEATYYLYKVGWGVCAPPVRADILGYKGSVLSESGGEGVERHEEEGQDGLRFCDDARCRDGHSE